MSEDRELTIEELDDVRAGRSNQEEWCPKVDVSKKRTKKDDDELTLEELDEVKAGRTLPKGEIEDEAR